MILLKRISTAGETKGQLLEVAEALEAGATKIFANDIAPQHLEIIKSRAPPQCANQLTCSLGRFPEELNFPKAFFDDIFNAKLFHFFDDAQTRAGLAKFQVG
jgi:hypothetical protein